ncbi:MAG TPA: tyrosinase family protein [Thermoanaerobaculia bacterium]
MDIRKNIYSLTDAELNSFITAVNGLKASGRYDDFIRRHHHAMDESTTLPGEPMTFRNIAHRGPAFLPWHRYFLREFELALQSVVPGVTLPYWDWAADAALPSPATAPLWNTNPASGRIYIGGDGVPPGNRVTTGPFASWTALIESGSSLVPRAGGLIRLLGRDPIATGSPAFPARAQVEQALTVTTYDSSPWSESQTTAPSFRNRLEGWLRQSGEAGSQLHNRVHLWVGGDMLPGTSPNDPVFFLHHCNVDRLWAKWQALHPGSPYVPTSGGPPSHNLNDVMGHLTTPGSTPAASLDYRGNLGYTYDTGVALIQGRFGGQGNFELVVPRSAGGLAHYWRNNDDPAFPWFGPIPFGTSLGTVEAVTLIQSNFGSPGNLEVIARAGSQLYFFWRDSGPAFTWNGPFLIASGVSGHPAVIQSRFGAQGNFELVVPLAAGGLAHYWRNNDDPALPWIGPIPFGAGLGSVESVTLIQSNFGSPGNLEVIARAGSHLHFFWRDSGPAFSWNGPFTVASGVSGNPALVQSRFGAQGNFELVVPLAAGGLAHYWRNNDDPAFPWFGPIPFGATLGSVPAVTLIQSNFGSPGNLEVIANLGDRLEFFWRDSGPAFTWNGPFTIATGF